MDHGQNQINVRPTRGSGLRAGARRLVWALEEKLVWQLGEAIRGFFELARWPFERLLWALQDRFDALGERGRFALAGGAALVVGVLAVALLALAGSNGSSKETAKRVAITPPPTKTPSPAPKHEAAEPTLHGAAPSFKREPPPQVRAAKEEEAKTSGSGAKEATTTTSSSAATAKISSNPSAPEASASSSSATTAPTTSGASDETEAIPGRPAGPKAIAVARRFSRAFVVYETGGEESKVRKAFAKTTAPRLAKALLRRPPRLPADVKVPRAKVVTIVPGPSREGVYTLSVSLLRVGATSELRLEMEKLKNRGWRVTNVLG